ncbi:hypothetical protein LX36DRAFT_130977 [Colletotrichum falcatum]|nr:hypothetical protein LX36DRAFT_130977 [Colletotrichum falcatum]
MNIPKKGDLTRSTHGAHLTHALVWTKKRRPLPFFRDGWDTNKGRERSIGITAPFYLVSLYPVFGVCFLPGGEVHYHDSMYEKYKKRLVYKPPWQPNVSECSLSPGTPAWLRGELPLPVVPVRTVRIWEQCRARSSRT